MLAKLSVSCVLICALAEGAGAEYALELGPTFVSGRYTKSGTFIVQRRWQSGWTVDLGYVTAQTMDTCGRIDCEWDLPGQWMIGGGRLFSWRRLSFGVGLYYVNRVNRVSSSHVNARLAVEYAASDHIAFKLSHISNGGVGGGIEICNEIYCYPDSHYNRGLDGLLVVWKF